jgi:hypothetical protein
MLTGNYRQIYFHHLKKCGGSTLNHWLDTLTFDDRAANARQWQDLAGVESGSREADVSFKVVGPLLSIVMFHWSDVVHSHRPVRMYAPENTFCLTVLRDPVQRLVSQVLDWRRLRDFDTINSPANVRECVEDSRCLSLRDFLEKHGQRGGSKFLDNYMTRAVAAERLGTPICNTIDPDRLHEAALQSLENDYDLIGLTEDLDLSRNALCAMVGLPPARKIPMINVTCPAGDLEREIEGARDILDCLTRVDRVIYDRACELFDQRHRQAAEAYDIAAFETNHAGRLLAEARGGSWYGATCYSVRAPLIGSGFHGRDGGGTPSCAVWSGPETRTTLYIPTPPDMALSLLVWVRDYVDIRQRDQLRVRVDGSPAAHYFTCAPGYADVLTIDAMSTRDFVRLEIDIDQTLASDDAGSDQYDPRERGFSFDSYGWRPLIQDTFTQIGAVLQSASRKGSTQAPDGIPDKVFDLIVEAETNLNGWCSREKAMVIASAVLQERPQICVEIGGRGLVPCAAALRHIGAGAIYGIEPWTDDVPTGSAPGTASDEALSNADLATTKQRFYRLVVGQNLTQYVRMIEAPSRIAGRLFDRIDFLHIDGSHSMFDAAHDVILYAQKVRSGGVIVFDNVDCRSAAPAREILGALSNCVRVIKQPDSGRNICMVLRRR